ncbi:MAG: hypothetical protein WC048_18090 [Rhizobium sp.]
MPMPTDPKAILDYTLARRSAAVLDLPELICLHRDCRRAHDCRYLISGDPPTPDCLDLLTPEDRARFDAFLAVVHAMLPDGPAQMPDGREDREMQRAACDVLQAVFTRYPEDRRMIRLWRRQLDRILLKKEHIPPNS